MTFSKPSKLPKPPKPPKLSKPSKPPKPPKPSKPSKPLEEPHQLREYGLLKCNILNPTTILNGCERHN